jgi:DNA-binding NarL/FixJ family response regulator
MSGELARTKSRQQWQAMTRCGARPSSSDRRGFSARGTRNPPANKQFSLKSISGLLAISNFQGFCQKGFRVSCVMPRVTALPNVDGRSSIDWDVVLKRGGGNEQPPGAPVTRILIADDHEVVRSGLRSILEAHDGWEVVGEAADGKEAVNKALETKPDVAIVDYSLPIFNGVEVTRQIKARTPKTEVLIFTMHESDALISDLLQAGARACLQKSDAKHHLISAIEALAAHEPYLTRKVSEKLLENFLSASHKRIDDELSPRERTIIKLIAEGHTNKETSEILSLSIKTIETHRAAAMRKLNISSTAGLVRYAIRHRLVEP